jgi:predicted glycosyltransferase
VHIVYYSQHVLGVGHFFRSLEIAKALAPHRVDLINGGEQVPVALPDHVQYVPLPPLSMDVDFQRLQSRRWIETDRDAAGLIASIMEQRRRRLMEHMHAARPDVFLVELFPFGRKRFSFELLPVLEALRAGKFGNGKAVCSVRDILVEKSDQARFEQRVLDHLNALFDLVLVHADPTLVRIEDTFSRVADIVPELKYTGYVTPAVDPALGPSLRNELGLTTSDKLIVASVGGGAVGQELLRAALQASKILQESLPHYLQIFTGPFMEENVVQDLHSLAQANGPARVERFTDRFGAWLSAADLSVSMAGYNTTMNLLAARTRAMVLPFAQNREQAMRALRLEQRGLLTVLRPEDLEPNIFSTAMYRALTRPRAANICSNETELTEIDLHGAKATAELIEAFVANSLMEHV